MSEYYSSRGLVLRSDPWRDGDRLATVLTREYGKLRFQIKSGLKTSHKLSGHLEPLTLTDITWARSRYGDTAIEASAVVPFYSIKSNLDILAPVLWGIKILEKILPTESPAPLVYALTLEWWWLAKDLKSSPYPKSRTLANAFVWQLLAQEGYAPDPENLADSLQNSSFTSPLNSQNSSLKAIRLLLSCPLKFWQNKKLPADHLAFSESSLSHLIDIC